jgi:hypothetical protein
LVLLLIKCFRWTVPLIASGDNASFLRFSLRYRYRGPYIGKYLPSPGERGKLSANVIWGKSMKKGREKVGKCKRKRKKGGKGERKRENRK